MQTEAGSSATPRSRRTAPAVSGSAATSSIATAPGTISTSSRSTASAATVGDDGEASVGVDRAAPGPITVTSNGGGSPSRTASREAGQEHLVGAPEVEQVHTLEGEDADAPRAHRLRALMARVVAAAWAASSRESSSGSSRGSFPVAWASPQAMRRSASQGFFGSRGPCR